MSGDRRRALAWRGMLPYIAGLFMALAPASGADYYVSSTGNDAHPGTQAQPWRSIARVNATRFSPGDRILFEGGRTFSGSVDFTDEAGTPSAPITITSYGNGRATIDALNRYGIYVYNAAGFAIRNLNIVGSGPATNTGSGIVAYADFTVPTLMPYFLIEDVEITGFGASNLDGALNPCHGWGIVFMSDSPKAAAVYSDIRIVRAVTHGNGAGGIGTQAKWEAFPPGPGLAFRNVYVGHSRTYNNSGVAGLRNHSGHGIMLQGVDGGLVEHTVAYGNGQLSNSPEGGPVGIWAGVSNNVTFQFNESYGNRTSGAHAGGGFDFDGGVTNSVMQYNYSHDNDGSGYFLCHFAGVRAWGNNIVRYNISHDDGRKNSYGGIVMWNGGTGLVGSKIYGNTVYISGSSSGIPSAMRLISATKDTVVRNNLLLTSGNARVLDIAVGQSMIQFQGNNYWSYTGPIAIRWAGITYDSLSSWQWATGQEKLAGSSTGFSADPRMSGVGPAVALNDTSLLATMPAYRLAPGSPMLDKGLDLRALGMDPGTRDFFGAALPQGPAHDIGAHELSWDTQPPVSQMAPVSFSAGAQSVIISWSGVDNDSGIAGYTIYVSKNGAAFTPWLTNTAQTQASFSGEPGNHYAFFSVAVDRAGNVEKMKTAGDLSLAVGAKTPPGCTAMQ